MTAASKMASEDEECANCGHPVYQAEAVLAANKKWHKRCFKCIGCNHLLSSATCNVWQGNLLCKHCLTEVTRPKSPMLYAETTTVAPEDGSGGCPRCGGAVFQAEAVMEKGLAYHKRCFTCINCNRPQTDKLQVFVGFDRQLYCKTCYPKIWHTPLPLEAGDRSKIKAEPGDESGCPRCGGKVFEAEKMASKSGWFHKLCFTCKICNRLMDYTNFVDYKEELFCKSCYFHHFDVRSYSSKVETGAIRGEENSFETCPKCHGVVFEAEKVVSKHNLYHKSCLACFDCNKKLDSSTFFDANDSHIYCRQCYSTKFGCRGRAKSVGPTDHQKIPAQPNEIGSCRRCVGRVFEAEKMTAKCGWFHKSCFKCFSCNKLLDATNYQDGEKDGIFCRTCHKSILETMTQKNVEYAKAITRTNVICSSDPEACCPRCKGVVFDAEKMAMRSGSYHKKCFTCTTCHRNLDYLLAVDGPNAKEVFCQSCYLKNFGPTEQKYNMVNDPKLIKSCDGNEACPRCGGAVFHAEEVWAKGRAFHRACSTCATCNKRLDSLALNCGPDGEIYCKTCHETHFGSHKGQPGSYHDVKSLKATDDVSEKCVKCHGKVFDLEKIVAGRSRLLFHKVCFNCSECKRSLNQTNSHSSKIYAFEPPESLQNQLPAGSIFCQKCHLEKFQDHKAKPCHWYDSSAIKDEKGCPRCGGAVFKAEEIIEKGISFHKKCFTCRQCQRPLNDKLQVFIGFDQEIYCKTCYPCITHTPLPMDPKTRTKIMDNNDPEACPRCQGKVFDAEKISSKGKLFHKDCFTCKTCCKILHVSTAFELANEVFCKTCYTEATSDGRNHYLKMKAIKSEDLESTCIKCKSKVFENERVNARSGPLHKSCMACFDCSRSLDLSSFYDGRDGGIYCQNCYSSKYGHKGRSQSVSREHVIFAPTQQGDIVCPGCKGKVFDAEKLMTSFGPFHVNCFKCFDCKKALVTSPAFKSEGGKLTCKQCCISDTKAFEVVAKAMVETNVIKADESDPEKCPRCSGKVFDAEKMLMKNGNYHKKCFSCFLCKRQLDFSNACSDLSEVYCNNCYFKNYGPVGVKYQVPSKDKIKAGDQGCPRCSGAVYEAEKVPVNDRLFHKDCLTCKSCNRLLDAGSVQSVKIQNHVEVFCQGCYSRFTGVAGFRGSASSQWTSEQTSKSSTWSDPSLIKSSNPEESCRKCQGIVYELERHFAKCGIYHKVCFKCDNCSKKLDSISAKYVEVKENSGLFCTKCFEEQFGSDPAPNIYAETSRIVAVDGKGCPRCKGVVFQAEEIIESGLCYHKQCFTCKSCNKNLAPDRLQAFVGFDKEVYCKTCIPRLQSRDAPIDNAKIKGENEAETCPQCKGKVFEAEKIMTSKFAFHKSCFKCFSCRSNLDSKSLHQDSQSHAIYCKNCYIAKNFTGKNSYMAYVGSKGNDTNDPTACLRCKGKVYEAEKVQIKAGSYHAYCLKCHDCQKQLEATSFLEARDKFIYCAGCYSSRYGLRSRARSCGPTDYKVIKATDESKKCLTCEGQVFESDEKLATPFGLYHRACFRCVVCNLSITSPDNARGFDGAIHCKQCFDRAKNLARESGNFEQYQENNIAKSFVQSETIKTNESDPDQCPRCKGKVFPAEMISMKNGHFHKKCFTCCNCKRSLDTSNACDGPNKDVFCNSCYSKFFGPMKRWFDHDKSFDTGIIKSVDGQGCPRCGGTVYEAEKIQASENLMFHRKCCSCKSCHQKLDSASLCNGPDKEIYCQNCHGRKFGGASFRGSMASTWMNEEASMKMRPCQRIDPSKLKIVNDPDSCRKCQGKVYEMERITSKSGIWHRQCFTCSGCNYSMTNTLDDVFDRQGQLFCRPCLKKHVEDTSSLKPMTYSDTKKIPASNDEEKCPKCSGAVFEAEKLAFAGRVFHQGCFSCSSCNVKLDNLKAQSVDGLKVLCQSCYKQWQQVSLRPSTPKSMIHLDSSDPSSCPRCNCKVFEAEKMMTKNKLYHKQCFTCSQCKHCLDYSNCMEGPNNEIYCKTCYVKEYFTGGRNKFGDLKTAPEGSMDDPETCPKCHRKVYEMERVQTSAHAYHKQCLSCNQCSRSLDYQNFFDARDGIIYCQNCYEARFGVKGIPGSFGNVNKIILDGDLRCQRCGGNVYEAEKVVTSVGSYHPGCFKCAKCSRNLDQGSANVGDEKDVYCNKCYNEDFANLSRRHRSRSKSRMQDDVSVEIVELNAEDIVAQSMVETTTIMADEKDKNRCPRCNGKVFEAEKMASSKNVFHRKCFTCQACSRPLDAASVNEGVEDGTIFCSVCYQRKFGPSVRPIVQDQEDGCRVFVKKDFEGMRSMKVKESTPVRGTPAVVEVSSDNCRRCNRLVYEAEKIVSKFGFFHQTCYNCFDCHAKLDSSKSCELSTTKEVHCKSCYNARKGMAGYGYGSSVYMTSSQEVKQEYHFTQFF